MRSKAGEGFRNLFLRRRYPVYVIDQPRRGNAGRSTVAAPISTTPDEQQRFDAFRVGIRPDRFPGVKCSRSPETLEQRFRQMTPITGPFDLEVVSDAGAALLAKIGPAILVTHSQGGGPGWRIAIKGNTHFSFSELDNVEIADLMAGFLERKGSD